MNDYAHIVLVEDNPDDYEATVRSLKRNHFLNPVKWCCSGEDALNYFFKRGEYQNDASVKTPDLILLDLNMPGVDGRTVLEELKLHPELKRVPVVILTTSTDARDIEACYDMGASTYIQKPVSFEGLTNAIRTMTDYWFGVAILPHRESE